jgi:hypothetical protein
MQKRQPKRYLQMLTVRLDMNGPETTMKMTAAFSLLTASGPAAPWLENMRTQFRAPFHERKVQGGSAGHGELT